MSGNIRKSIVILSLALVVFAFSRIAMAADFTAKARIAGAIIVQQADANSLDFGVVLSPSGIGGGSVTALGRNTTVTGTTKLAAGHAGTCDITGEPGLTVDVAIPSSGNITLSNGTATMDATIGLDENRVATLDDVPLGSSGKASVPINGVLTIGQNQAAGTYTGTYTVNVTY